jgi:hypothetical protein
MKEAAGIESSQDFMLRMLKTVCLKWLRGSVNMGGRFGWNTVIILQPKNNEISLNEKATIYYWDESSINQNHTEAVCCKTKESFSNLRVPVKKSDCLAISHGGSVVTRFIPQTKLNFPSKSGVSTDYHGEINLGVLSGLPSGFYHTLLPSANTGKPNTRVWLSSENSLNAA